MGTKKQHFVLVHGGCHGAWCWVKVVPLLKRAGHRVTAVDLLGAGENWDKAAEDITSGEEYDTPLTALFEALPDDEKVILVGHSMGGMTISRMSERFPKKICVAIYLHAFMPGTGNQNPKIMNELAVELLSDMDFEDPSSLPRTFVMTPEILRDYFYNSCSLEDYNYALDRIRKCNPVTFIPPNNLTAEKYGSVPKIYVLAHDDKAVLPKHSRRIVELNPPDEFVEIEGDHSTFFCALETVEKILLDAAAKYGSL